MTFQNTALMRASDKHLRKIEVEAAPSELDDFVYIVSHDLRNSARALSEIPQWLRSDLEDQGIELSEDSREDFELLERHSERLDRMLLDLLTYSRVGRLQEITAVPLGHLVARVLDETAHEGRIKVHCAADLPTIVMGYKDGFVLVKCMIENVIRHCPPTGSDMWIEAARTGDEVALVFRDNGPGVPEADLPRMFRPMTTLKRRDDVEGSGMGLAIVHRIARHYRGAIEAGRSPQTGGLEVRITLNDAGLVPFERVEMLDFDREG